MDNHESQSPHGGEDPSFIHPSSSSSSSTSEPKRGGWNAITYILGNESFEKLASMSLIANLTLYLRTKYNMSGLFLINVVTIWSGTTNISSIAGAVVSDVYLGRFLTLLFGSIFSLMGMATVTLTAAIDDLRPPFCQDPAACQPYGWQLAVLFIGLGLLSIGAGGIRPCNIAFGADQFDTRTKKGRAQLESFFNWWYFLFTVALLVALTGVVYVQTNISWTIGFAIPTACFVLSISIFLIGRHTYIYIKPQGSAFVGIAKVIVAANRKRKITLQQDAGSNNYYNPTTSQSQDDFENQKKIKKGSAAPTDVVLTDRFNCFNKAAVIVDSSLELDDQGNAVNSWNLCSLEQVEQLKCLIGIMPVWFSGIGCFVVMDQQVTFGILQAIQMDESFGPHFKIPPGWMGLTSMLALSVWIILYERVYMPLFKKDNKKAKRLTMRQRIQIGIIFSVLCMVSAGFVERKRRDMALKNQSFVSPLSIGYLLPQFVFAGLTEAFAAVACMEFFTIQMPETMRSVSGAVFFFSLSVASYLSSFIVNVIHKVTQKPGKLPWLGGHDLNEDKLDYYYFLIATLAAINFLYFTLFASKFVSSGKVASLQGDEESVVSQSRSSSRRGLDDALEMEEEKVVMVRHLSMK